MVTSAREHSSTAPVGHYSIFFTFLHTVSCKRISHIFSHNFHNSTARLTLFFLLTIIFWDSLQMLIVLRGDSTSQEDFKERFLFFTSASPAPLPLEFSFPTQLLKIHQLAHQYPEYLGNSFPRLTVHTTALKSIKWISGFHNGKPAADNKSQKLSNKNSNIMHIDFQKNI